MAADAIGRRSGILIRGWQRVGVLTALVLLVIAASFLSPRFMTVANLLNVLRQVSIVGILAIGMTFVILTRGIDLSVGSILGIAVVLFAGSMDSRGMAVAIPIGLAAAALAGLVNGIGIAYGRIPAFIMTLGMLSFVRGLAFIDTGGTPVPILSESFYSFGNGYLGGVPIPALILIGVLIVSGCVLGMTPFGRSVYAIGSNEDAARLSGVPVEAYKIAVYVISGLLAGLAGLVYASQLSIGTPIAGQGYELDAIAATVVGGTSLFGGKGSVGGTFLGTLIIGVLANILNLTAVRSIRAAIVQGCTHHPCRLHHEPSGRQELMRIDGLMAALQALQPDVDRTVTRERVRRYLSALVDTPAPSTAASAMRVPVLRNLLDEDGAFAQSRLHLHGDFGSTGSAVILTGSRDGPKPLWYFAHLDTISYLVQPLDDERYPLVPFCYHLMQAGACTARAYRYDVSRDAYAVTSEGRIESEAGAAFFRPADTSIPLRPGDRVVPVTPYREHPDGRFTGHMDNAGAVAALAVAAPVLARAGIDAMLAFPDEEEGPPGSGNQVMGRGATRIVNLLPVPDLAIVADVQQAGGGADADARGGVENATRLGGGAVLTEFSSLARGAVTPPHLYMPARHVARLAGELGVKVQESNNAYTSRSDDVSVMLKTPNILLLGFPGFNRHFDRGEPYAHLDDVVHLAKALVYMSVIRPWVAERRSALLRDAS